jgi:NADH-quinone oxidoreductase subunit N
MLAFSSVAHAGYILAALAAGLMGLKAAFFYVVIYTFMNMGAFACAAFLSDERAVLDSFRGLSRRAPGWVLIFVVFLLSLAGLPPLAGFLAKFFIIGAAVETGHYVLAAAVVLNSLAGFFYYLKVVRTMYFDAPASTTPIRIPFIAGLAISACFAAVLVLGIWPQPVMAVFAALRP